MLAVWDKSSTFTKPYVRRRLGAVLWQELRRHRRADVFSHLSLPDEWDFSLLLVFVARAFPEQFCCGGGCAFFLELDRTHLWQDELDEFQEQVAFLRRRQFVERFHEVVETGRDHACYALLGLRAPVLHAGCTSASFRVPVLERHGQSMKGTGGKSDSLATSTMPSMSSAALSR